MTYLNVGDFILPEHAATIWPAKGVEIYAPKKQAKTYPGDQLLRIALRRNPPTPQATTTIPTEARNTCHRQF